MANNTKVTYSPDFDYKKSYSTIGNIELSSSDIYQESDSQTQPSLTVTINDIASEIASTVSMISILPSDISDIIRSMLSGILYSIPYIDKSKLPGSNTNSPGSADNAGNSSDDDSIGTDTESENNGVGEERNTVTASNVVTAITRKRSNDPKYNKYQDENGRFFGKIAGVKVTLPTNSNFKKKIKSKHNHSSDIKPDLVDAFDYSMLLIYSEFLDKIKTTISDYSMNLAIGSTYGNIFDVSSDYDRHTSTVETNLQHLNDSIIKTNIIVDQKLRLTRKLYTTDNCIDHFNSVYTSKEFYLRYKDERYQPSSSTKDTFINSSLRISKSNYYSKYVANLTNIYKYYNSCAVILNECLDALASSFVSKNILG